MEGTIVNVAAVVVGGLSGIRLRRLPGRVREMIMQAIGLATLLIGVQMGLETRNLLGIIVSLVLGAVIGEALHIEEGLDDLGRWAERRLGGTEEQAAFTRAFVTSSLLFCVGPLTLLGAIQDGLGQPPLLLYTKSLLDGITAVAIGAALGAGVLLSAVTVLVYQGTLTLAAGFVQRLMTPEMTRELTATGGVLIVALGLGILQIRRIRVANLLPALLVSVGVTIVAPRLGALARALGL
jgi:uncharacterized membrane protein YqgA involved in biofilm formation